MALRGVDYIDLDGQKRNAEDKVPSLIILDEDLVKVGEFDLPANTFYTRTSFSYKGKIYLPLNPHNGKISEDELVFVGFEPVKKMKEYIYGGELKQKRGAKLPFRLIVRITCVLYQIGIHLDLDKRNRPQYSVGFCRAK